MNCIICHAKLKTSIDIFGKSEAPLCQSCFLDDNVWIYSEPEIINELQHGVSLGDAIKKCIKEEITELNKFAFEFFADITAEEDTARMVAHQAGDGLA